MPQEELEVNSQDPQENPDETAAVLSFATMLRGNLLKGQQPQTQENGNDMNQKNKAETIGNEPEIDLEANKEIEKTMDSKIDELRKEIKETIKEELSSIKDSIKEALEDDE